MKKKCTTKQSCLAGPFAGFWAKRKKCQSISPLSQNCSAGRKKICKITGDRKMCARMASMGVLPGEEVQLLCGHNGSQCVLRVGNGTVSLDSETIDKILVESL
ncbi:MAG: ferrous iron transport protein A [Desulfopila sp.]|jgi:Fe2+ transport system protein FeoA|nr:ferrous iron transport protein A [Desulfopila sp.]